MMLVPNRKIVPKALKIARAASTKKNAANEAIEKCYSLKTLQGILFGKHGVRMGPFSVDISNKFFPMKMMVDLCKGGYSGEKMAGIDWPALREDWSVLKGKRVLDIACGSGTFNTGGNYSPYNPWLSRGLFEVGAEPVGIDIMPNKGEPYENHQVDIRKKGSLDFLGAKSFDFVVASNNIAIDHESRAPDEKAKSREFLGQVARVLKDGGYFIEEGRLFQKRDGRLAAF